MRLGYTILYVVPNVVTNPSLFSAPMVDPIKDFAPVVQLTSQSYVLLAHPSFAPKTMPEIIAKAKQGGVSCASGGGLPTFGCEWLRSMTKADFLHIPYKGNAPALNDLIGGQVNLLIDLFNTALPQIRQDVAINGPGANLLTVRRDPGAGAQFRVFFANIGGARLKWIL